MWMLIFRLTHLEVIQQLDHTRLWWIESNSTHMIERVQVLTRSSENPGFCMGRYRGSMGMDTVNAILLSSSCCRILDLRSDLR